MSFFEPPPPPPPPEEPEERPDPWFEAPTNELGAAVPLRLLLARTETIAVAITDASAYTTGVSLTLAVRRRPRSRSEYWDVADAFLPHGPLGSRLSGQGGELSPKVMRFGVQFADGRKATTLESRLFLDDPAGADDPAIVLSQGSAGGSLDRWDYKFWLWPLPPQGPVIFAVEWPAEGIGLTKLEVDADLFLEASRSAEVLWPPAGLGDGGTSWSETVGFSASSRAEAEPEDED